MTNTDDSELAHERYHYVGHCKKLLFLLYVESNKVVELQKNPFFINLNCKIFFFKLFCKDAF